MQLFVHNIGFTTSLGNDVLIDIFRNVVTLLSLRMCNIGKSDV